MQEEVADYVTIAILAKNKAHCLPLYLKCLLAQTFPKNRTNLYIRTNNNTDGTASILEDWVRQHGHHYHRIYYDETPVDSRLEQYTAHEWNSFRFAILGKIRQESISWAKEHTSHYFVADCDNFIHSQTIEVLLTSQLPVVGPFLITGNTVYSNFHHRVDQRGYFIDESGYHLIYNQYIKGLIGVDVIHCTYLIRYDFLNYITYLPDGTGRHEYVIFSEHLRHHKIQQYLDNRHVYGRITFADDEKTFVQESWLEEFANPNKTLESLDLPKGV